MNQDEIIHMEAGPKMNALVAEKVMEWKNLHWKDEGRARNNNGNFVRWPAGWYGEGPNGECYLDQPFSSSIADAWKVVEKIVGDGDGSGFVLSHSFRPVRWIASFDFDEATGDTAPLAICRAALLASLNS